MIATPHRDACTALAARNGLTLRRHRYNLYAVDAGGEERLLWTARKYDTFWQQALVWLAAHYE